MAEDRKFDEESYVAKELDSLSLTSSVYTTPLFRRGFNSVYIPEYGTVNNSQDIPYPGLFISDDFVFPPSEHENLPIESELELNNNSDDQKSSCAGNNDEGCNEPAKEADEKSDGNPSVSDLQSSAHETTNPVELPQVHADQERDNTTCKLDLPCEGWWKRKSTCLSQHIKGMATVCTIVTAGALMGFVIIGQRWQQDKLHLNHFQFSVSSEGMNRLIGIFSRCKDALPGSQQLRSLLPTRVLPQQQVSA